MHNTRHPAFTLVEMLVVISIIAVLIGILIPVLASARNAGKAAVCMSNMRQLAVATTSYTLDHDKRLPQPSNDGDIATATARTSALWFNAVDYYLQQKKIQGNAAADRNYDSYKQDPAWANLPDTVQTTSGPTELDQDDVRTLKMNMFFGHVSVFGDNAQATHGKRAGDDVAFYRLTEVPEPSSTVLYADGRGHDTPTDAGVVDGSGAKLFALRPLYVGLRHDDGSNLTMVDGSVQHQINPIEITGSGYRGWHNMYDNPTFTPADRELWPEAIFNFRPESFGLERRYPPKN